MGFGEVLREFGVKISLAFDGKKFEEVNDKVEKLGAKLSGVALGLAGATAGVFEFQNLFTSNARSLQNQADLLGISTEKLQEYEYAAKIAADVNRDELAASLQTLGNTMDKARAGDLAARQALEQIGGASGNTALILGRLNDKTYKVTDAFKDLSGGIQAISKNSPQAASRLTEMTLGNAKLYNLLKEGPKAIDALTEEGKKNFALNENMIRQGAEMDKQMSRLWMTFRKFGYEIGFSVMKHLAPMIQQFTRWFEVNKKVIASGINTFLDALANGLKAVWEDAEMLVHALGPVIDLLGGSKNAVNALIGAFVAYKTLGIAMTFIELGASIYKLVPAFSILSGLFEAFKSFTLIETLADVIPALQLFGSGALAALTPLLPVIAAIAAGGVAIHDLMTILSGGNFKDTWTGKGWEKVKEGVGWVSDKVSKMNLPTGADYAITPNANPAFGGGANGAVDQDNHFETNVTVSVPPGTTMTQASGMVSKATVDSHEKLMIKAKLDAARSRQY